MLFSGQKRSLATCHTAIGCRGLVCLCTYMWLQTIWAVKYPHSQYISSLRMRLFSRKYVWDVCSRPFLRSSLHCVDFPKQHYSFPLLFLEPCLPVDCMPQQHLQPMPLQTHIWQHLWMSALQLTTLRMEWTQVRRLPHKERVMPVLAKQQQNSMQRSFMCSEMHQVIEIQQNHKNVLFIVVYKHQGRIIVR